MRQQRPAFIGIAAAGAQYHHPLSKFNDIAAQTLVRFPSVCICRRIAGRRQ